MTAPAHKTLAEALAAAQADMPAVEKDSVNPHFKSKFVSLDHLIAKTRPVLNKHGISISQWPSYQVEADGQDRIVIHTLVTVLTHTSGDHREQTMALIVAKNDMQGLGAALTYAKRYAWSAALGISTDEDDDGNQASQTTGSKATGATQSRTKAKVDTVPAPLATDADIASYRTEVEDAGFDWDAAYAALKKPVTAAELTVHRGQLADAMFERKAEEEGIPFR